MKQIKTLHEIAEDLLLHVQARLQYVQSIPAKMNHEETARMILGERLHAIVSGDRRPFDMVEALDTLVYACAHFAVSHGTSWGLPGPQLVPGSTEDMKAPEVELLGDFDRPMGVKPQGAEDAG